MRHGAGGLARPPARRDRERADARTVPGNGEGAPHPRPRSGGASVQGSPRAQERHAPRRTWGGSACPGTGRAASSGNSGPRPQGREEIACCPPRATLSPSRSTNAPFLWYNALVAGASAVRCRFDGAVSVCSRAADRSSCETSNVSGCQPCGAMCPKSTGGGTAFGRQRSGVPRAQPENPTAGSVLLLWQHLRVLPRVTTGLGHGSMGMH